MWFFKKKKTEEEKASAVSSLIAVGFEGQPVWTPREYDTLAKEGYQKNVIAYRAIDDISKSAASVPWKVFKKTNNGKEEVENNEIAELLERPNPNQSWTSFVYAAISYLQIAGNSYIEAVTLGNGGGNSGSIPQELWTKRPDRMKVVPGTKGVSAYEYEVNGQKYRWEVNAVTQQSNILHAKLFHPLEDWYGMSPIEAAAAGIDIHNQFGSWNMNLMQNFAKPSGLLISEGSLTNTQILRLKAELKNKWAGAKNAGKPLVLEGGLKWQPMSFSPKDLDWINGKDTTARDICYAFGYPPFLLGLPGNSTFNNMEMAKLWLWENVVSFYLNMLRDELNVWLLPKFNISEDLMLDYDTSEVPALSARRSAKWEKAKESGEFATINERRAMVDLSPINDGDVILVQATQIPLGEDLGLGDGGNDESEKAEFKRLLVAGGRDIEEASELAEKAFK